MELVGNPTFNRTIWPARISVFDDLLTYRKRSWFAVKEITISYNQIAQATLHTNPFFSHLEIVTTGTDDIIVRFLSKKKGKQAKKILDQKIYHAHSKLHPEPERETSHMSSYEKSLSRYKELLNRGRITKKDYEKRKEELLKKVGK